MTTQPMEQQTYLAEPAEEVAELLSFLTAHETTRGIRPMPGTSWPGLTKAITLRCRRLFTPCSSRYSWR